MFPSTAIPRYSRVTRAVMGKMLVARGLTGYGQAFPSRTCQMLTNALSAKAVASLKDGKHRDGQGLQFEVKGGSRRWTFTYMFEGRQRELAIGKYPTMSLADARAKRAELREAKDRGIDPRRASAGATVPDKAITFRHDTETFIAHMRGEWTAGSLKEWQ